MPTTELPDRACAYVTSFRWTTSFFPLRFQRYRTLASEHKAVCCSLETDVNNKFPCVAAFSPRVSLGFFGLFLKTPVVTYCLEMAAKPAALLSLVRVWKTLEEITIAVQWGSLSFSFSSLLLHAIVVWGLVTRKWKVWNLHESYIYVAFIIIYI